MPSNYEKVEAFVDAALSWVVGNKFTAAIVGAFVVLLILVGVSLR
jgi:hypothetical protein